MNFHIALALATPSFIIVEGVTASLANTAPVLPASDAVTPI